MRRIPSHVFALLVAVAVLAAPLAADAREPTPRIVNGTDTQDWPTVAALIDAAGGFEICTATMIGCQTAMTAAHCVCFAGGSGPACPDGTFEDNPAFLALYLQNVGDFAIASISVHPSYTFGVGGDVALLHLATPVNGLPPSTINTTAQPSFGTAGTIVGYGITLGTNSDGGVKRTGKVVTADCVGSGVPNATHTCWNFVNPVGPPGDDSNTCVGDSGGPLFANAGGAQSVVGVTSGGLSLNCTANDASFDTDVFAHHTWIESAAGADLLNTTCGSLPQVGGAAVQIDKFSGTLSSGSPQMFHTVEVPADTQRLVISLNSEDGGASLNDHDLYIRHGSPPTTMPGGYDCSAVLPGVFEDCIIDNPTPGTWHILAQYFSGVSAQYQVTSTIFETPAAVPALGGAGSALLCALLTGIGIRAARRRGRGDL